MRIAVVGAGVAGLGAAWLLNKKHDVVVYESSRRLGGHACTVDITGDEAQIAVDVGFIVFNERNYPNFVALLDHLAVPTDASNMSFAVSLDDGSFEYGGSARNYLKQWRNSIRPSFWRMTHDIFRFNRVAPHLLAQPQNPDLTIGDFVRQLGLSDSFRDNYLAPMASCIWSTSPARALEFPAQAFVRFFDNHGLLTWRPQKTWRTVRGGSRSYVECLSNPLRTRLASGVVSVRRDGDGVTIRTSDGHWDRFERVVMACHADQAVQLLDDADARERAVLGRFAYAKNEVVLHGDTALMPRRRAIWSSWNYVANSDEPNTLIKVTYWMNRLQKLETNQHIFVSLNPARDIAPTATYGRFHFEHPIFNAATMQSQAELEDLQGTRDTYFCGSYCGYGFHEDALAAGLDVAERFGVVRPWVRPVAGRQPTSLVVPQNTKDVVSA